MVALQKENTWRTLKKKSITFENAQNNPTNRTSHKAIFSLNQDVGNSNAFKHKVTSFVV